MLIAHLAVFFERFVDYLFELWRDVGIQRSRRGRDAVENRVEDGTAGSSGERLLAAGHFVEHRA